MIKSIDNFFRIGKDHKTCDDFSVYKSWVSRRGENLSIAVVSDGCSDSENSSIGARLISSFIVRNFISLSDKFSYEELVVEHEHAIMNALISSKFFDSIYGEDFLDATLLISLSNETKTEVFIIGDGSIFIMNRDGSRDMYSFEFDKNMPMYASYIIYGKMKDYLDEVKFIEVNHNGVITREVPSDIHFNHFSLVNENISRLVLCTDGCSSFSNESEKRTPFYIGEKLLSIKTQDGVFFNRRINKIFEEEIKEGYVNYDDIAATCIIVGE